VVPEAGLDAGLWLTGVGEFISENKSCDPADSKVFVGEEEGVEGEQEKTGSRESVAARIFVDRFAFSPEAARMRI
jgi:hypothetical protein